MQKTLKLPLFVLFLISTCHSLDAQVADTLATEKQNAWIALPLVFYTPETSWGFGGAALHAFRLQKENLNSRPSQFQLGFAYTLRNQLLTYMPFQLYIKNEKYKLYGELGYYRYIYDFSGIGNDIDPEKSELYSVNYPRFRINALYGINREIYLGLRYWMDDFDIVEIENEGLLANAAIPGAGGGFLSGLGLVANYDTRDNIFYPSKGLFTEMVLFHNGAAFGSDFNFSKLYFDGSLFLSNRFKHTLALNVYSELSWGNVPFNQLSLLGGPKRMRGYYEGNYRDKQFVSFQAEYRMPLFWRFGLVAFAGYGGVAEKVSAFQLPDFLYSIGGGLRFTLNEEEKINLRLDAGFGKKTSAYYITFTEAF